MHLHLDGYSAVKNKTNKQKNKSKHTDKKGNKLKEKETKNRERKHLDCALIWHLSFDLFEECCIKSQKL